MTKRHFLAKDEPMLVCMVQAYTPERVEELMELSRPEGAEAFGMQFCRMKEQYKNKETFKKLFAKAGELPVYVTNYRQGENSKKSDGELAEGLIELAECGATLCDVMGDVSSLSCCSCSHDQSLLMVKCILHCPRGQWPGYDALRTVLRDTPQRS